jgi:hypothetical protein
VTELAPVAEVTFNEVGERLLIDVHHDLKTGFDQMVAGWRQFMGLVAGGQLTQTDAQLRSATAAQVVTLLDAVVVQGRDIADHESEDAHAAYQRAISDRNQSVLLMGVVLVVALAGGVGAVLWLIRSVLPRTLAYSSFAARLAEGNDARWTTPSVTTRSASWVTCCRTWRLEGGPVACMSTPSSSSARRCSSRPTSQRPTTC